VPNGDASDGQRRQPRTVRSRASARKLTSLRALYKLQFNNWPSTTRERRRGECNDAPFRKRQGGECNDAPFWHAPSPVGVKAGLSNVKAGTPTGLHPRARHRRCVVDSTCWLVVLAFAAAHRDSAGGRLRTPWLGRAAPLNGRRRRPGRRGAKSTKKEGTRGDAEDLREQRGVGGSTGGLKKKMPKRRARGERSQQQRQDHRRHSGTSEA
jgi:hypothetical protein